jgi:DNA mismatch repair protein MutS
MRVKEWKDSIIFLHEVAAGTADRSYGIHVAKLAGLPSTVIIRAEEVLKTIEGQKTGGKPLKAIANDLPLFSAAPAPQPAKPSAAEEALKQLNPDTLSPKDALEALYRLKELAK